MKVRARTVDDLAAQSVPYVTDAFPFAEKAVAKHWAKDPEITVQRLLRLGELTAATEWTEDALEQALRALAEELELGAGKLIHPLRVALTGQMSSPGIFEVMVLLGRGRCLARVEDGVERVRALA